MIKVLLVDDHSMITSGIKEILNKADNIIVIGIAKTGEEGLIAVEKKCPDVILMDIEMPGMGGREACRRILKIYPEIKIIGLSRHENNTVPKQLLKIGAVGFIAKTSSSEAMIAMIHEVMRGNIHSLTHPIKNKNNPLSLLSSREHEVVQLITQGKSIQEMADLLNIKYKTINTYRYRMYKKLQVKNDVELVHLFDKFDKN